MVDIATEEARIPAPARISALTVSFMAASTGIIVANLYYIQPLLADVARAFGLTVTKIGFVAMLSQVGTSVGMLLFVPLGDTKERRSLITILLLSATLSLTVIAMAHSTLWLALACFVLGMTGASVHVFVPFAAHLAPAEQRGRVVGSVFSGILLGILLARTFSGAVGAHLGWRAVYGIAAALMLSIAVLVQFLLPHSKPTLKLSYAQLLQSTVELVRAYPALRESAFFGALLFSCFTAFWTTLVFFLEKPPYHYGSEAAGLFGLVGAAGAAAAPLVGRFTDTRGPRVAIGASLLSVLAAYVVLWAFGTALAGLIVGVLLMDMGVQAGHVANQTRIYGLEPAARSRLNMFYMVCYFTGGAAGTFLGAYAWRLRAWPGVCALCLAAMGIALVVFGATRSPARPLAATRERRPSAPPEPARPKTPAAPSPRRARD
jgi:predicted MFS family arabinose efflux permease